MQLETRDFTSFAILAEQLHFGRAAARLHVSQPALSKRIKSLKRRLADLSSSATGAELRSLRRAPCSTRSPAESSATLTSLLKRRAELPAANWGSCALASACLRCTVWFHAPYSNSARPAPESKSKSPTCPRLTRS